VAFGHRQRRRGSVVVIDLVTDKRIILNAGESYLARAPR
jgi:hypothetical protein